MSQPILNHSLKDSSLLVRMAALAMDAMGLDIERIMARCGIDAALLEDHHARTPHLAQRLFWQVLEEETGDPLVGLKLSSHVPVYHGQVLAYLFLSSKTFGEGLNRTLQYRRLITDAIRLDLQEGDGISVLAIAFDVPTDKVLRHRDETFCAYFSRYFRVLTEGEFVPRRITFTHAPVAEPAAYREYLGCDVLFGAEQTAIEFDSSVLQRRSTHSEPELLSVHEQLAKERLARVEQADIVESVRQVVGEMLEKGQPELSDVAARLDLSTRNLRSRLSAAGTSFNEVVSDYRYSLARHLLAKTGESIADVVYLTGFSEPSTFYRAFKRWSGMTPAEYRDQKQSRHAD